MLLLSKKLKTLKIYWKIFLQQMYFFNYERVGSIKVIFPSKIKRNKSILANFIAKI